MILQLVQRHLVRRHHELPIAGRADLQRHLRLQLFEMIGGDDVEADVLDAGDLDRFPFGNRQRDVDLILLVVQLHVEAGHAGVGIAAVAVEGLNPFQIGVEPRAVEVGLLPPRNLRALARGECVAQAPRINGFDAVELQAVHLDGALFFTGGSEGRGNDQNEN